MQHVELVDRVYSAVKNMIQTQELTPGQKLVQERLAARLGVSRSPLLKALQRLEGELLVERIPRRGVFVKSLDTKEIRDVFQCRAVIEGLSARLAAERITPAGLAKLKKCFAPFLSGDIDAEAYAEADRHFHQLIMDYSGNAVVTRLELLTNIHAQAFQAGLLRPPTVTLPEHLDIIAAIEAKDGGEAERLIRHHVSASERQIDNE